MDNVNSFISINAVEFAVKNFCPAPIPSTPHLPPQKKKSLEVDGFTGEIYQILKEETLTPHKHIHKTEEEETFSNSYFEASITVIPKIRQIHYQKVRVGTYVPLKHRWKKSNRIFF